MAEKEKDKPVLSFFSFLFFFKENQPTEEEKELSQRNVLDELIIFHILCQHLTRMSPGFLLPSLQKQQMGAAGR